MAGATGKSFVGRFGVHAAVLAFVVIWTIPTLGILVSSLRDKDQIIASGWWSSFSSSTQTEAGRLPAASAQVEKDGKYVLEGNIFGDGSGPQHQRLRRQGGQPDGIRGRHAGRPRRRRHLAGQCRRQLRHDVAQALRRRPRPAPLLCIVGAAEIHHRQLPDGAVFRRHRPLVHEFADRHHPRDRHPDPDRRLRRLRAGLDALSRPRAADRGDHRPAGGAAADVADPAAETLQRRRRVLRRSRQDLSRHLAGAYRLRPALRDLSAAQLHRRPAARADGIGAHRRRQRLRDLRQDRAAAVVPGAGLLRHLPVPVGVERPARRHGVPRHRSATRSCSPPSSTRCSARAAAIGRSSRPRPSSPSSCR